MIKNIGRTDRMIRFGVAAASIVAALAVHSSAARVVLIVVAVLMAGTALVRTCPAYLPFHVSTNKE